MAAFIACCARSGSTLLRLVLDAHPELACPAETDLAVLVEQHVAIDTGPLAVRGGPPGEAVPAAHGRARAVAEALLAPYLEAAGKSAWCDKSLSNVFHLERLAEVWPEARFVLLHRHCMDMVLSGLEASPWGLAEYGFGTVAQRSPTDTVVALAAYWADRTARMVAFERRLPERCLRLRYEDLVADPDGVVPAVLAHLGLAPPPGRPGEELAARLARPRTGAGPADHTIWYTPGIHGEAVGRGARVPPDHVAGPLREHVNALLGELGYPVVDDAWGSGTPGVAATSAGGVELRVVRGHAVLERRLLPAVDTAAGEPASVVVVEAEALAGLSNGRRNLGAALRAREVRWYGPPLDGFDGERRLLGPVARYLAEHAGDLAESVGSAP